MKADFVRADLPGARDRSVAVVRTVGYATYLGVLIAIVIYGALTPMVDSRKPIFQEGGTIEAMQATHIAAATALFAGEAIRVRLGTAATTAIVAAGTATISARRWMPVVFMLGCMLALHREFDYLWKRDDLRWEYHAIKGVIALPLVIVLWRNFEPLRESWWARPTWPPYLLLYVAIGGYAMAQFSSKVLEPLGVPYVYAGVIEESAELLAGACFPLAAIELTWRQRHVDATRQNL